MFIDHLCCKATHMYAYKEHVQAGLEKYLFPGNLAANAILPKFPFKGHVFPPYLIFSRLRMMNLPAKCSHNFPIPYFFSLGLLASFNKTISYLTTKSTNVDTEMM